MGVSLVSLRPYELSLFDSVCIVLVISTTSQAIMEEFNWGRCEEMGKDWEEWREGKLWLGCNL